ncbi:MAG: DeoR/GlpR transcriptional regulator [Dorea sp.]|jgi:DeoR/GlpR family transcriptional regulator of sugar metabolism|nr:DeoR/GlpR transcriptional regulator [Dorea sp.]
MLQERRKKIMEMLQEDEIVKVSELMHLFDVSIETIRRDLEYLEERGSLSRVYGGAVLPQPKAIEPSYEKREVKNFDEKKAIGEKAVELVQDNDIIAIDIGTTTLEFAKALVGKKRITVITNSMKIAMVLTVDPDIRVIMLGGEVRSGEFSVSGSLAVSDMNRFNTEKLFLGIGGLSLTKGLTDYHMEETNLRRIAIANTQKVIALADYSKIGVIAMNNVCGLEDMDILVTDSQADHSVMSKLQEMGIDVIVSK